MISKGLIVDPVCGYEISLKHSIYDRKVLLIKMYLFDTLFQYVQISFFIFFKLALSVTIVGLLASVGLLPRGGPFLVLWYFFQNAQNYVQFTAYTKLAR